MRRRHRQTPGKQYREEKGRDTRYWKLARKGRMPWSKASALITRQPEPEFVEFNREGDYWVPDLTWPAFAGLKVGQKAVLGRYEYVPDLKKTTSKRVVFEAVTHASTRNPSSGSVGLFEIDLATNTIKRYRGD
ncbi:MAG: hypothetical protein PHH08_04980 [Candidatus ainarchaeum sp.]|nr:hypothetical protein [Candidatus ainarchaeum sp.]